MIIFPARLGMRSVISIKTGGLSDNKMDNESLASFMKLREKPRARVNNPLTKLASLSLVLILSFANLLPVTSTLTTSLNQAKFMPAKISTAHQSTESQHQPLLGHRTNADIGGQRISLPPPTNQRTAGTNTLNSTTSLAIQPVESRAERASLASSIRGVTTRTPNLNSAVEKDNQELGLAIQSVIEKMANQIRDKLAPARCYIDLIGRFNEWVWRYRKLEEHSEAGQMKPVLEMLKEELGRANEELEMEMCLSLADLSPAQIGKSQSNNARNILDTKFESVDYLYQVLMKMTNKLETLTRELEKARLESSEEAFNVDSCSASDDEKFKRAMERIKRVAMNAAGKIIQDELKIVSKVAAFNSMAYFVDTNNPFEPESFGHVLVEIVAHLGGASTPVTVAYLRNLELRAAMSVLLVVDPLPWISCAVKKSKNKIMNTC